MLLGGEKCPLTRTAGSKVLRMDQYAPYKVVERALASVYGADDAARRGAFRARLDNLKRARVLGVNPGKGQRNTYDLKQISKLLVALKLEEFGVTPAIIAKLFTARWELFSHIVARAARKQRPDDQDILLWIYPQFLSARWRGESELPEIGKLTGRRAMEQFYFWLQPERPGGVTELNPRACVFNLSSRWRAFEKALTTASMAEPPHPPDSGENSPQPELKI